MKHLARCAATAVGVVAAVTFPGAISPAESATPAPSRVTVHTTDHTPASGQTFRLYGAVRSEGEGFRPPSASRPSATVSGTSSPEP